MTLFDDLAPVLSVADLSRALAHYERLGFTVEAYDGAPYGYVRRGDVWMHLTQVDDHTPVQGGAVYLYVGDADALHAEWAEADVEGRLGAPQDMPYGLREGFHVDPDGTLLRFGSWLPGHGPGTRAR
ncbi:MAG TPA: VOC family protein [Iamia sp.]|nr:VOC family protein [Iamia sp.]HXH57984.1 VOC family protein [Iamia sp.]